METLNQSEHAFHSLKKKLKVGTPPNKQQLKEATVGKEAWSLENKSEETVCDVSESQTCTNKGFENQI